MYTGECLLLVWRTMSHSLPGLLSASHHMLQKCLHAVYLTLSGANSEMGCLLLKLKF